MTAAATSDLPLDIRPMRDSDRQFVFETTVKVRWPRRNSIPWAEWLAMHGPMVEHWMRDGFVVVADSGGVLLGFAVSAPTGIAMLYVKRGFRGDGLGMRLLAAAGPDGVILRQMPAILPTPSWQRWCERRGLTWERAAC